MTRQFWHLVLVKIRLNLRSEASRNYLSYAWCLLEPLLQMGVFYLVFDTLLNRGTQDFVPFLLCGVVAWLWFSRSVANSSRSLIAGRGLINQTHIPKAFFPMVVVGQDLFKQAFVLLMLLVIVTGYGYSPSLNWLWLIPVVLVQLLLIGAAALVVAFVVPFARDLQYLISAGLTLLMFCSGIFYSYLQVLLPEHRQLFLMNPMANLIVNYRRVLLDGVEPFTVSLTVIALVSLAVIWLMHWLMQRMDNRLTRLVAE